MCSSVTMIPHIALTTEYVFFYFLNYRIYLSDRGKLPFLMKVYMMLLGMCGSAAEQCISVLLRYPQDSQSTLVCPPDVTQATDLFQSPAKTD